MFAMAPSLTWFGRQSSRSNEKRGKERSGKARSGKEKSKRIEKELRDDKKKQNREVKVLLLGSFFCPDLNFGKHGKELMYFDNRRW